MPRPKKTPTRQASGGARLIASGKRPMVLGFTDSEYDLVTRAAEKERRPRTQYAMFHLLAAARRTISENPNE